MTKDVNIYTTTLCITVIILFHSCKLFDKELKQDQHIERFRYQLGRVQDSLDLPIDRIEAFKAIAKQIEKDKDLITPRKKNRLMIDANNYISNEYMQIKNYAKALEYGNISISLDSTNARSYFNRGSIYQTMDKDSLAIKNYSHAIGINSNYADAYYNRGIIYEKTMEYKEALADYNLAIEQRPPYLADIYNNRGNVYLALKDSSKAMSDYTKVLNIDPMNVNAYSNRAGLYIKQKELEKALADCNRALTIDSAFVRLYKQRAIIYEQMKDFEKAVDDYKKILKLDPSDKYKALDAKKRLKPLIKQQGR
jgi:tetratricopeptide (TPR) repeat protein